jgi:rSAM/selenodomain-associated transferase 1
MNAIVVFARYPEQGKVKTRLGSEIGHDLAVKLYRIFIRLTLLTAKKLPATQAYLAITPGTKRDAFAREFCLSGWHVFTQRGEDLGARMKHAFDYVFKSGVEKAVIIGSDSPTLPADHLQSAMQSLQDVDLVLGPAQDGGYYLIALRTAQDALFRGITWSSNTVFRDTLAIAARSALKTTLLPEWYDVDDHDALVRAALDDNTDTISSCLREHRSTGRRLS